MNIIDFSRRIKTKYPQYEPIDDALLVEKVLEKYPQYKSVVDLPKIEPVTSTPPIPEQTPLQQGITEIPKEVSGLAWIPPSPDLTGAPPPIMTQPLTQPPVTQRPPTMPPTPFELAEAQASLKFAEKAEQIYRTPVRESLKGWGMIVDKIPDPETKSVMANVVLGLPKTLFDISTTYGALHADPLVLVIGGAGAINRISQANRLKLFDNVVSEFRKLAREEGIRRGWDINKIKDAESMMEYAVVKRVEELGGFQEVPKSALKEGIKFGESARGIYAKSPIGKTVEPVRPPKPEGFSIQQIIEEKPVIPARPPQVAPEAIKPPEPPLTPPPPVPMPAKAEIEPVQPIEKPEVKPPEAPPAPRKPEIHLTKNVKATLDKIGDDFIVETMAGEEIVRGAEQVETVKKAREIADIAEYNRQQDIEQYKTEKTVGNIHAKLKQLNEKISIKSMKLNNLGGELEALRENLPQQVFRDIFTGAEPSGTNSIDIVADHLGMDSNELLSALGEYKHPEKPPDVISYIEEARAMLEAEAGAEQYGIATTVVPVNYNKSKGLSIKEDTANYRNLKEDLENYDIKLLDAVEFENGAFISASDKGLLIGEKPAEYKVREQKEMFEPEKKNITDRFKEYYSLARQQGMTQPEARKYALERLKEPAKPVKAEPTEKPEQIEIGDKEGVKGFGAGRKGEQELFDISGEAIDKFEKVKGVPEATEPALKLFEKSKELIHKYAERIGEKYTSRMLGKYYVKTKNIFVNSMNNVSTVIHEVAHYIDDKVGFTDAIRRTVGTSKSGNPIYDPATKPERKMLTDVYVNFYGGKKNHKLEKRMLEGYAKFIQKFAESPSFMNSKYPELVNMFLRKGGKYYDPIITDLLKDARDIVKQYQSIDPLQQIGSRVMNDERDLVKSSFLNFKEKLIREILDNIYPIEKLAIGAGKQWTKNDPSLWMRLFNNIAGIIVRNINSNKGYHTFVDGDLKKLYDYNWKTLVDDIDKAGITDDFSYYLVSRRVHFSYQKQDELKAEAIELMKIAKQTGDKKDIANAKEAVKKYRDLARINKNDNIDRGKATQAYESNKERFEEYEKKFDSLVRADLDFLASKEVQFIKPAQYQEMIENEGYATFKRDVYNEIIDQPGSTAIYGAGKTKVSSLKGRTGSELPIINPVYSSMKNHAEIIRKGLRQVVLNKIAGLADKFPDVFQELPLEQSYDTRTGRISYPQEKDPNIIMARENYKRVPILTDESIIKVIDEVLDFKKIHWLEKIVISTSRMFTKGTTALYPQFTITNFMLDQFTATAQTVENYKPVYDQLKLITESLINNDSKNAEYFKEYLALGADRQTFVGWMDMSPRELFTAIEKENKGLKRVLNHVESGFDVLAIPSKYSEIVSRATEYIKSRKNGDPQIVALEKAGRVTAPFHHTGRWGSGSVGRTMIKSIPFFNASMEVLAQYGRTWLNPKTRSRAAFVLMALTAGMVGSMAYYISKGTKRQKDDYKQLYSAETANYIYFPHPNGKTILRFRIPEQMGVIGSMINMVISDIMLETKYSPEEYIDASTSWLPDQFNISDPIRAFFAWWPQLLRPITEILMNVRTYPKRKPIEYRTMKAREPEYRYYDSTSKLAIKMGRILKLSPIKIDYLIEGYLGRFTRFFTGSGKKMNPLVRDIYLTSGRNLQRFYETREDIYQKMNTYRADTSAYKGKELSNLLEMNAKIKYVDKLLSFYRKIKKLKDDKKDESKEVLELRTKILDEIDSL